MSNFNLDLTAEQINDLLNKLNEYGGNLSLPSDKVINVDCSAYSNDSNNSIRYVLPADGRVSYNHMSGYSTAYSSARFIYNGVPIDGYSQEVANTAAVLNFSKDLPKGTVVTIWGSAKKENATLKFVYARSSAPQD